MRRFLCYVVMIVLVFFIQTGIFTQLPLGGIVPNLFIICTASIGMLRGKAEGCLVGFFFGILMDTLFSGYFGFYALIFSVIGYLTGYIKQIFYEEDMTLPDRYDRRCGYSLWYHCLSLYLSYPRPYGFFILFQKNYPSGNGLHTDYCCIFISAVQLDQPED